MEQLQQQQHVEDVGRILLQTQDQLRQLREQLAAQSGGSGGGVNGINAGGLLGNLMGNNNAGAEIEEILQRAEHELRIKAELVLNNLVTAGPSSPLRELTLLPFVRRSFASPVGGRRRRRSRHDVGDAAHSDVDLEYFRQHFKSGAVEIQSRDAPPVARGGGLSALHQRDGRLVKHKTSAHARLLPFLNKLDPAAPRPVLSPVDAQQGVLSLLHRGFLPANVDLTPAFRGAAAAACASGVLSNGAVRLYRRDEQPVRAVPYSNPTNFNLANLKFDMATPSVPISNAGATITPAAPQPSQRLKTVTIDFAGERRRSGDGDDGEVEEEEEEVDGGRRLALEDARHVDADAAGDSDANSMDDLRRNVDKIRGYNELLDTYSLHQFIIHKGRAMRETPEFQSFKRVGQEIWGGVEEVIRALEALLTRYFVPLAYIDGQRLMGVASMEQASFSTQELLSCIVNEDQVASLLRRPGQRYKGKDRKRRAATTVQAFFRMLLHRNRFRKVRRHGASAMLIQKTWRACACQRRLRLLLAARRAEQLTAWRAKMARLRAHWRDIAQQRRVVVHVPSLSLDERARLSLDNFAVQQNLQLSRLAALVDANVELVYVAPFELPPDVAQYVTKLLALGGVAHARARVTIVFPEHAAQFPAHFSLASLVLYSPHCLRRIRRLVRDREAYLVLGVPGVEDERLALALQLPVLGFAEPRAALPLLTRSGSKRFFIQADVNVPTGTYDLYDVGELLFSLAKLILSHLDQNAWLLRLDSDPLGTGTAVLDVAALATLREIRRENKPPEYWKQPGIRDAVARALLQELEARIATLARPCHPELFATWREFAAAVAHCGVVVEALPAHVRGVVRANLLVEPSGDVRVVSTQDVLTGGATPVQRRRRALAFAFPQTLVPHEAVVGASQAVGRRLFEHHAFSGYASVDLQLFHEESPTASPTRAAAERLWAVALHPYLTDSAATFAVFQALHRGAVHPLTGAYQLAPCAPASPTRCYVAADFVAHPNVATMPYRAFFHACRLHGVCFDVERCVGSVFALADSLTAGVFGVFSSGESPAQAAQFLRTAFEVIGREVGSKSLPPAAAAAAPAGDATTAVPQPSGNFAELLALLRHRVAEEKDKDKEQRQREAASSSNGNGNGNVNGNSNSNSNSNNNSIPARQPLLRVGKKGDSLRRMRRTSQ